MINVFRTFLLLLVLIPTLAFAMEHSTPDKNESPASNCPPVRNSSPPLTLDSQGEEKEGLYLVVGSTRAAEEVSPYWQKIIGGGTDFTHKNTYGGKAITLNVLRSKIKGLPHIKADATTYNPGRQGPIQAVFFELFPSLQNRGESFKAVSLNTPEQHKQEVSNLHLMPNAIVNLAKYMPQGASLDIEHIPHIASLPPHLRTLVPMLRNTNPFSWYLSPLHMEALESLKFQDENKQEIYWKVIKALKMRDEHWDEETATSLIDEARTCLPSFRSAIHNLKILLSMNEEEFEQTLAKEVTLYKQDRSSFFSKELPDSLSFVIAQEACMLMHGGFMMDFLKKHGFENVDVGRKDNPYNGRENVWMISAIRNDQPIDASE